MEGFNNMQEPLRTQDELQNLQIPGKNSPQEVDLLRKQMLNESLSEQIKDLKEGDEITVRTVNSIWDPSIQDNQDYVHYHNMFFAYADKNDKGDVFFEATFPTEEVEDLGNTKRFFTANSGEDIVVFRGFGQRVDGEIYDEDKYLVDK